MEIVYSNKANWIEMEFSASLHTHIQREEEEEEGKRNLIDLYFVFLNFLVTYTKDYYINFLKNFFYLIKVKILRIVYSTMYFCIYNYIFSYYYII